MTRKVSAAAIVPFVLFLLFPLVSSAVTCPKPGERPATADDAVVQNNQIPLGTCYDPSDTSIGQSSEQAKADLQSMRCSSGVNVQQLDSKFAVCADKFMKQLRTTDSSACINSAFRDEQQQAAACKSICGQLSCPGLCAAPGHSYHQKGLALDMKSSVSNQNLWTIAAQSGLINPAGLHRSDPRHVQSSPGNTCAGVAVPSGDGGDFYGDTNHFFPAQQSLPFDNSLRNALGLQPAPPPPPTAPTSVGGSTTPPPPPVMSTPFPSTPTAPALGTQNSTPFAPGTCAPQTYCSQQDGNIYYRATTCVDQVYQKCASGCTGFVCNATSTASNSQLGDLFSDTNTNTNTNLSNGTSTFDLIDFFAQGSGATAATVGTATPIAINQEILDTADASVLNPNSAYSLATETPAQGTASSYDTAQQQTFTSGDLSNSPSGYTFAQTTFTQQIYAQMKATLIAMLPYLQPFGGVVLTQSSIEE